MLTYLLFFDILTILKVLFIMKGIKWIINLRFLTLTVPSSSL